MREQDPAYVEEQALREKICDAIDLTDDILLPNREIVRILREIMADYERR